MALTFTHLLHSVCYSVQIIVYKSWYQSSYNGQLYIFIVLVLEIFKQ